MKITTKTLLCASAVTLSAFGCGSYAEDPAAPTTIATIRGDVKNLEAAPTPSTFRVALVWMGEPYNVASELSLAPKFPASFELDIHQLPPHSAMQTDNLLPNLKLAAGAVVGYEDVNGNGKLDMVDSDAAEFVDHVVATNEHMIVLYAEGSAETFAALPPEWSGIEPGFNLMQLEVADGFVSLQFHPMSTMYDLFLSTDPRVAELMCKSSPGESAGGGAEIHMEQPATYPDPSDPHLTCGLNGESYVLEQCTTISEGPCKGTVTSCTGHTWWRPDPVPADWPCP
jgi:hypothetical protein